MVSTSFFCNPDLFNVVEAVRHWIPKFLHFDISQDSDLPDLTDLYFDFSFWHRSVQICTDFQLITYFS